MPQLTTTRTLKQFTLKRKVYTRPHGNKGKLATSGLSQEEKKIGYKVPMLALPPPLRPAPTLPAPGTRMRRLDFNNIIAFGANVPSSFQPKTHATRSAGSPNTRCIYFTVVPAGGNVNFGAANHQQPNIGDSNIYFPVDGNQPTTANAIIWSCARIDDNNPNSPITEWYMRMFGVIPLPGGAAAVFVQAGWDNSAPVPNPQRIITFTAAGPAVVDPDTGGTPITRQQFFERKFRQIASTSVGRVLLYRILIEIRRRDAAGVGCLEVGIPLVDITDRNENRSLQINCGNRFVFNPATHNIIIHEYRANNTEIGVDNVASGYTNIPSHPKPIHVSLFHEFIHWHLFLRDTDRSDTEVKMNVQLNDYGIGQHFWQDLLPPVSAARRDISSIKWRYGVGGPELAFEDMRVVLGATIGTPFIALPYREGDDISENLYRLCIGIPLRFGYDIFQFQEDINVIGRVIAACNSCRMPYTANVAGAVRAGTTVPPWAASLPPPHPLVFTVTSAIQANQGLGEHRNNNS